MTRASALSALLAACGAVACGGAGAPQGGGGGATHTAAALEATVTPAEGASAVDLPCAEGAPESENAADDDCDGVIDEDRPDERRDVALMIAATWGDLSDVDLTVVGPDGETPATGNGSGVMDRRGRGACEPDAPHPRIEDAKWADPRPGAYRVELRSVSPCGQPPVPTTAAVSVAARGRTLGTWAVRLEPAGRAEVLVVELR